MPKHTAGVLMFRRHSGLEVLLIHPGGPLWAGKDEGAWSLPKGECEDEEPLEAAKREFEEETGFKAEGEFVPLRTRRLPSGKVLHAWALEGDADPSQLRSNTFEQEWPPKSGQLRTFPEVDKAAWFLLPEALEKVNPGQRPVLEELAQMLGER